MDFGAYIQKLREEKGLPLAEAARQLGLTPQRLCDMEAGRRNFLKPPPLQLLKNMSVVYDHPYAQLVSNTGYFQFEKTIVHDLLGDLEPIAAKLEKGALDMLIEARQYTPEMEVMARDAVAYCQDLKAAILLAKTRYSKGASSALPKGALLKQGGKRG